MSCAAPISWLRLERHHLGEADAGERAAVEGHLASCADCAAALARIAEDETSLPALPAPAAIATAKVVPLRRRRALAVASTLLAAAGLAFAIGRVQDDGTRTKGAAVAFSLVREDEALVPEAGGAYHDGDRFKPLVTCAAGTERRFDLVVYENGAAAFPLPPAKVTCENAAPLGGAFRVTGRARMIVCLVWSDDDLAIDREAVRRVPPERLEDAARHAICRTLDPAP